LALLYLVRHSESAVDPTRPPEEWDLTDRGRELAGRLAASQEWKRMAAIGVSREPKALLTADPIAKRWRRPLVTDGRFGEVTRPFAGSSREFEETVTEYLKGRALPAWERISDAANRFEAALSDLRERHLGDVAVVSHGTIMAVYLSRSLGIRFSGRDWSKIAMPDVCVVDIEARRILRDWGHTRF
jgi:broad specificity phosphatase PhoE